MSLRTTQHGRWTYNQVLSRAEYYDTRGEFFKNDPLAYNAAKRLRIFEEVTCHMKKPFRWTNETLFKVAKKYTQARRFFEGDKRAYIMCCLRGIINEACEHMDKHSTASDKNVVYIWSVKEFPGVYKIGVTSERCGNSRIDLCFYNNKGLFTPGWVIKHSSEYSDKIEKHLLKKFTDCPDIGAIDGKREFRTLSDEQLKYAISYIMEN